MKKFTLYLIGILLMINIMWGNFAVFATEENSEEQNNIEVTEEQNVENNEEIVHAKNIVTAEIIDVKEIQEDDFGKFQEVKVEILEGDFETEEFTVNYYISSNGNLEKRQLTEGDIVIVEITSDESGNASVLIRTIKRTWTMVILIIVLILSYSLFADKKMIKSILSLLITIVAIYFILLNGMQKNQDILKNSILFGFILILINSVLNLGFNKKMISATISSFIGIIISGLIAVLFTNFAKVSSFLNIFTFLIQKDLSEITFANLIFVGVFISSLGVCTNIAVSTILGLDEIKNKTKDISWKELYKDGIEIGKNLIKNEIHSLILIYFGAIFIITFTCFSAEMQIIEVINSDYFVTAMISAISGSIGMILTVPISVILYGLFNRKKTIYRTKSHNKLDGQRSLKL